MDEKWEKLRNEWDAEKNSIEFDNVKKHSGKKYFWKCQKGHSYMMTMNNKYNRNSGCPICSNRVVLPGFNDLQTTHPDLCKEWDFDKNDIKPTEISRGCGKKVWWKCPLGHSFEATPNKRTSSKPTNCPICFSTQQTSFREQAVYYYIKKTFPNTINRYKADFLKSFEIDIFIPELKLAIEYDGSFWHKNKMEREIRKYQLCKENNIKLWRIREEIKEGYWYKNADELFSVENIDDDKNFENLIRLILRELDPQTNIFTMKSTKYLNFIHDVNLEKDKYEILSYRNRIDGSIEERFPEIAKEWHPTLNKGIEPSMIKAYSSKNFWWLCPLCGREYKATPSHRANGLGCTCNSLERQLKSKKQNLLDKKGGIQNQLLLKQWNYSKNKNLTPNDFTEGSCRKVWWLCDKCGHEWEAKISNRIHGRGCPKCAGRLLFSGYNDFATCHPELLIEWDYSKNIGIDPSKIHRGSTKRVWWKCKECGYEYIAPLARRDKGSGCRLCANKKLIGNKYAISKKNT